MSLDREPISPASAGGASVEQLLAAYQNGDESAFDRLISLLYDDLLQVARRHLRGERSGHTLSTTALVHEAYLRLAGDAGGEWRDRAQFLAFVSRAMRHVLVDHARRRGAGKRGGGRVQVTLRTDVGAAVEEQTIDLLALDHALDRLADRDPRLARVVECRFFGGMTAEETAEALGISLRTVERDWMRARAYLHLLLQPAAEPLPAAPEPTRRGPLAATDENE
jgi:RNA polymerase sigma factor (TIGR02999 family)